MPRNRKERRLALRRVQVAQQAWFAICSSASATEVIRHHVKEENLTILRPIHFLTLPLLHAYIQYKGLVSLYSPPHPPMGYHSFVACRPKQVKDARCLTCLCVHCEDGREAKEELAKIKAKLVVGRWGAPGGGGGGLGFGPYTRQDTIDVKECEQTIIEFTEHQAIYRAQDAAYRRAQEELPEGEMLWVMDFTATRDSVSKREKGDTWWSHNTIHWFNIVCSTRTQGSSSSSSSSGTSSSSSSSSSSSPTGGTNPTCLVLDASDPCLHPCPYLHERSCKTFSGSNDTSVFDKHGRQMADVADLGDVLDAGGGRPSSEYVEAEARRAATPKASYPLAHKYYDWFSPHDVKNDALFVYTAIMELLNGELKDKWPKKLTIWSDGGPKHFKQRRALFYMWLVSQDTGIPIEWHFFCSCHGKCRCDGHFGCSKCCHGWLVLDGTELLGVDDYVAAQNLHVPDTVAWRLSHVDTPTKDVEKFVKIKIKSCHRFCFTPGIAEIKA